MTPRVQPVLYGHQEVESQLLHAWQRGCLPHGMIFVGPQGVGKATCAFHLARFLLAQPKDTEGANPTTLAIDPGLPVSRRIASSGHGDLFVLEPKAELASGEITVDQVRSVGKFLSQTAMEGGWRIVIIDGRMNRNAANAVLKSLEEPPSKSLLILMAESLGSLTPTVRSRCAVFKFGCLSDVDTLGVIKGLRPEIKQQELSSLLPLCAGRPGRFMVLHDGKASKLYRTLLETLLSSYNQPIEKVVPFCQKIAAKPKKSDVVDPWQLIGEMMQTLFQRLARCTAGQPITEVYPGESAHLTQLLAWRSMPEWAMVAGQVMDDLRAGRALYLDRFQVLLTVFRVMASKDSLSLKSQ